MKAQDAGEGAVIYTCASCGRIDTGSRLRYPAGWTQKGGQGLCKGCLRLRLNTKGQEDLGFRGKLPLGRGR